MPSKARDSIAKGQAAVWKSRQTEKPPPPTRRKVKVIPVKGRPHWEWRPYQKG